MLEEKNCITDIASGLGTVSMKTVMTRVGFVFECHKIIFLLIKCVQAVLGNIGHRLFLDGPRYAPSILLRPPVNSLQYGLRARSVRVVTEFCRLTLV